MNTHPVVFIAFEEFDNLGVGYLSSVLSDSGYESYVIDFRDGKKKIQKALKKLKPFIVGFSIIFEYHIYEFAELIYLLRKNGIKCHFTAGGQYASLKYEELFKIIPLLDSVVRFDGEYTFLELVNCISSGTDWRNILGIAYQNEDRIIVTPLRKVESDLDKFPLPVRSPLKRYAFDKKFATILAGRGCVNNCIFCYLREYYQQSSGPVKRIREPEKVVTEMELLHIEMNCSVFLFQDDDFPVKTANAAGWINRFCKELKRKNLTDKIMWKINCRPDEVDYDSFSMMKNHGMYLVFLGIEDGTDIGLTELNKHMTVAKCIDGINILKKLGIGFDYGFMLFQPSSTYRSIEENLIFLGKICNDGYSPVMFLKMLPYSATPIEAKLRREGRLKGKPGFLDYDFLDESINHYYEFITDSFARWLRDPDGLLNTLKWARNYISVYMHFFGITMESQELSNNLLKVTSESNLFLLDLMKVLAKKFESGKYNNSNYNDLKSYRNNIIQKEEYYKRQVNDILIELMGHFQSQQILQTVFH
jgi:anaerobic magnesium-protoporphyrin IX monomethyl ester cyclase